MVVTFHAAEGLRDELLERLKAMEIATADEPGCLYYELNVDRSDPFIFYFREGWESQEALDAHDQTPHVRAIRADEARLTKNGIDVIFMEKV